MAMNNDRPQIYLDHNAATPVAPEVLDAMLPYLRDRYGNPCSDHPPGRRAAAAVAQARAQVAALIGADPANIVFTSGGTESNNLVILPVRDISTAATILATAQALATAS